LICNYVQPECVLFADQIFGYNPAKVVVFIGLCKLTCCCRLICRIFLGCWC